MKGNKLLCDNAAQDRWANYYLTVAKGLGDRFGMLGRAAVRDAIRMFAAGNARERRTFLTAHGKKPHLKHLFYQGGPLPCGDRCVKEWIRVTPQEVFVNVADCPYAVCWNGAGEPEVGKMFCEEYYPAYVHAATSEKAQINVGRELVNEGDTFCRLSVYLRPANLPQEQRGVFFEEFDNAMGLPEGDCPSQPVDYDRWLDSLHGCFAACAKERLGEEGAAQVEALTQAFFKA